MQSRVHAHSDTHARLCELLVLTKTAIRLLLSELQSVKVSICVFDFVRPSDQLILITELSRQADVSANQNHRANHQINLVAR